MFDRFKKNKSFGFTLIELLLVVVLISILSGVILSVLNINGIRAKSRDAQRSGDLKRLQTALELYFADNRGYPANSGSWQLVQTGSGGVLSTELDGTYIQNLLQDPYNSVAISGGACGLTNYGYYYRTTSCVGAGCKAGRYVLMTVMETNAAAETSACSSISNCSTGSVASCDFDVPCYCVENPL